MTQVPGRRRGLSQRRSKHGGHLITVYLRGRLGNILFQYAAGRALAIRNRTRLRLDLSNYDLTKRGAYRDAIATLERNFSLEAEIVQRSVPVTFVLKVARRLGVGPLSNRAMTFREDVEQCGFEPRVLSLHEGARLVGYFQSERYFADVAPAIRKELAFRGTLPAPAARVAEEIGACESVGVHVRRGDYIHSKRLAFVGSGYYIEAFRRMGENLGNPRFFVFSDDMPWCRENLRRDEIVHVEAASPDGDPLVDMRLMSLCRHNVIANSSFSWWAAWLNANPGKTVVAPENWFKEPGKNTRSVEAVIPERWIRIAPQ